MCDNMQTKFIHQLISDLLGVLDVSPIFKSHGKIFALPFCSLLCVRQIATIFLYLSEIYSHFIRNIFGESEIAIG